MIKKINTKAERRGYGCGELFDMLHAFRAIGVPRVGDDESSSLAVRRHQELHAGLDVFVVETLVRDIEEVIAARLVEVEPHIDLVEECLIGLGVLQRRGTVCAG